MKLSKLAEYLEGKALLTKHDLARRYGVTLRAIELAVQRGRFPRPLRIYGVRWAPADVAKWEADKAARKAKHEN